MKQFILFICLLVVFPCSITARDPTQRALMKHLAQAANKRGLISNETFISTMFQTFRSHHPRRYRALDNETERYQIFQNRLKAAIESTIETNLTFTYGLNKYSDWPPHELQVLRGTRPPPPTTETHYITMTFSRTKQTKSSNKKQRKEPSQSSTTTPATLTSTTSATFTTTTPATDVYTVPDTFDYTTRVSALNTNVSIIRPIRDQGYCGSCYAFAIITLFEAQYAFHYGQAANMSDQQIIDCSTGDYGCRGGYFDKSFAYVQGYNWYLNSALKYPYRANASTCAAKTTDGWSVGNSVYRHITPKNVTDMQEALVTYGLLWISLYVGSDCSGSAKSNCPVDPTAASKIMAKFQGYTSGVFKIDGCITSASNNNHAMVIVGYGHDLELGLDYWKLRNSWGAEWGEDGYVRIQRGVNMCNVESDAFFIAKPAP
ncbi:unnamed protein product [Rotaria sordida]|uniref:Uncharacterized protein n=2 Tax=Rotaria sordida TaxID=392033 RepID=A0A814I3K3_9BILA|nr:unnamed protein product [Rotaria sordida]CAF1249690.1 unnamed protein product [Rotaria sordida]